MIALLRREFTVDRPIEMAWQHLAGFGVSVFGRLFAKFYSKNPDRAIPLLVDELKSGVAVWDRLCKLVDAARRRFVTPDTPRTPWTMLQKMGLLCTR